MQQDVDLLLDELLVDLQLVDLPEVGIDFKADQLDVVLSYISPDRGHEVVQSLLLHGVRSECRRLLRMLLLLSVVRSENVRTHVAMAGKIGREYRGGDSGSVGFGSPIYRLVS